MSKANGTTQTGKVRPAWADSSVREQEEREPVREEEAARSAAPETHTAPEQERGEQRRASEPSREATADIPADNLGAYSEAAEYDPGAEHDGSVGGEAVGAPSFGKKNLTSDAVQENTYPHSGVSAPTRIKAAIHKFVERISGGCQSAAGGGSTDRSPSGEVREPTRNESPEQVEKRLRRSLRETTIEGFRRIAFGSPKGGVGKSSLAYTVAGAIARSTNLRVCLVDADPNFGATRYLVPRPVEQSVLDLADDADRLERLADLRTYVSQNEQMGLDVLLNPVQAAQISSVEDLAEAYAKVDAVLSRFYDLVIYDLGLGFRDEAIRGVLELSDELVLISDAEVIPNAQLPDALRYVEGLGVNLAKTTLTINHGRPPEHESASTTEVRGEYASHVRRVTEVPYDAALSQLLNTRAFHIESLSLPARLGVLTTAAATLEGLRRDAWTDGYEKVLSLHPDNKNGHHKEGGR